jgi:hypothetical protein
MGKQHPYSKYHWSHKMDKAHSTLLDLHLVDQALASEEDPASEGIPYSAKPPLQPSDHSDQIQGNPVALVEIRACPAGIG